MECHTRVLITAHMCVCPKLVVQSERYPIDRLNIAINHMYIMISPTYADVNKLSKTIMAHLGKKTNRPNLGCFQKKQRGRHVAKTSPESCCLGRMEASRQRCRLHDLTMGVSEQWPPFSCPCGELT